MQTIMQKILRDERVTPKLYTLEEELLARVTRRIEAIQRVRIISFVSLGSISAFSLYNTLQTLINTITTSGVGNYVHIIIDEDIATLSLISKEILYSIIETLPIMTFTLMLGTLFMTLISINGILLTLQQKPLYNK